ncbi:MAG: Ig-like domain-containing protein [Clostridia bacterium]|nr:Ig-like domain-containing protein [Clostridia bacterium]
MKKKLLALILTMALLITTFPLITVNAEPTSEKYVSADNLYEYTLEDGKATITMYRGENYYTSYTVPEAIDGYPVVAIGGGAYGEHSYFKYLTIPSNIKRIDYSAFYLLPKLETVYIEKGVEGIDSNPFDFSLYIKKYVVSEENENYISIDGALFTKDKKELIEYPSGKEQKSYTVPAGVTTIRSGAVENSHYIETIILPEGLIKLDNYAIDDCPNLKSVYVPDSATGFGKSAIDADEIICSSKAPVIEFAKKENVHITYIDEPIASNLKITVNTIKWPVGKSSTFAPVITPAEASKKLTWTTSDAKVATISQSGKLTAVGIGTATITCKTTDGSNLEASCKVVVRQKGTELTKNVNITVDTIKWPIGKSSTFAPVVTPSNAQKSFIWTSSDPTVATVSQTGKLTAVGVGETTITCMATDGTNLFDTCKVIVYDNNVKTESVKITVDVIRWPVGKASTFAPVITPEGASKKLTWTTSDEKVATISQSGKLTAVGVGEATITCKTTDGTNLEASCKVVVREKGTELTKNVNITVDTIKWPVGKSSTFAPFVYPSNSQKKFEWTSSNEKVATVSQTGKLTAVSVGEATITCKTIDGTNLSDTCKVIVYDNSVKTESVKITVEVIRWPLGKSSTFVPVITPAGASKKLVWTSSDEKVATISQTGKLTAVGIGAATIICKTTDGTNLEAKCRVFVREKNTELTRSLTIPVDTIRWPVGKSSTFNPVVEPSNAQKRYEWKSSDETVATVSETGKLTAVGDGVTTITCRTIDGTNLTDTCTVIVGNSIRTESLYIKAKTIKWPVGKSSTFAPIVSPVGASNKFAWTTSDEKVATISQSGKLTAVGIGTATITCKTTDGTNLEASCIVYVREKDTALTENLDITVNTIRWGVGKSSTFAPEVYPRNAQKIFEWTTSDEKVATISQTGKLTAVGPGEAKITCKTIDGSGLSDSCLVVVSNKFTQVEFAETTLTIKAGDNYTLTTTFAPEDASQKLLKWTSTNTDVAYVNDKGEIYTKAAGTTDIICKATDGSNLMAICRVIVTNGDKFANYRKLYDEHFKDGTYVINGKADYVDEDGSYLSTSKIQFGIDGTDNYMYEQSLSDGQKLMASPNGTVVLLPQLKLGEILTEAEAKELGIPVSYLNKVKNYYWTLDKEPLPTLMTRDLTYITEETETIDGVTYTMEIFGTKVGEVAFYFTDGKLCYFAYETDETVVFMEVTDIQDKVNYSEYKIPSGYTKLDIPLE